MDNNIIFGKIPTLNALNGNNRVTKVFLNKNHPIEEIFSLAKEKGLPIELVEHQKLNELSSFNNHQGVVCLVKEFIFAKLEPVLKSIKDKEDATVVMLDQISDPVNFGSIIRSSVAFGVDAIIIGKHRQIQVTPTVSKIATGGEELIPIIQVVNLNQTIEKLKQDNYWIITSAGEGSTNYDEIDYKRRIVLVIGSEGFGASKLVKQNSDYIASIPLDNKITALNASIATAVFLAQISSYRKHH